MRENRRNSAFCTSEVRSLVAGPTVDRSARRVCLPGSEL